MSHVKLRGAGESHFNGQPEMGGHIRGKDVITFIFSVEWLSMSYLKARGRQASPISRMATLQVITHPRG